MCRNTQARGRPTGRLSGEIFWLGGSRYVVQRSTAYNLSPRTNCYRMQITRRGWPSYKAELRLVPVRLHGLSRRHGLGHSTPVLSSGPVAIAKSASITTASGEVFRKLLI